MAITEKEKEQLRAILAKVDGMELVRIGGMIYESVRLANIPTPKLLVLGKFLYAGYTWSNLPKEINDVRHMLVKSAEDNILKMLPEIFTIVPEGEQTGPQEETSVIAPVTGDQKNLIEEAMQAAPTPNDPTAGLESLPGGDTEIAPPSETNESEPAASGDSPASATSTLSTIEEISEDDQGDDPLEGMSEEADEEAEEEIAANPQEPAQPVTEDKPPQETPAS